MNELGEGMIPEPRRPEQYDLPRVINPHRLRIRSLDAQTNTAPEGSSEWAEAIVTWYERSLGRTRLAAEEMFRVAFPEYSWIYPEPPDRDWPKEWPVFIEKMVEFEDKYPTPMFVIRQVLGFIQLIIPILIIRSVIRWWRRR